MLSFIGSLSGCAPRCDVGHFLVFLSGYQPLSDSAVIFDSATGSVEPICASAAVGGLNCTFAQGTRQSGPFLITQTSLTNPQGSFQLMASVGTEGIPISGFPGGLPGTGSVSPSGDKVVFTQSSAQNNPSQFFLWQWNMKSSSSVALPTQCISGSAAYPKWNAEGSAIAFICYKRLQRGTLGTTAFSYNLANSQEALLFDGDPVLSLAYSPLDRDVLAAWTNRGLEVLDSTQTRQTIVDAAYAKEMTVPANAISWSGNGAYLLFALQSKNMATTIFCVDVKTKQIRTITTFKNVRVLELDGLLS